MSVNVALVRFIHPAHRLGYGIGISAVVIATSAAADRPLRARSWPFFPGRGSSPSMCRSAWRRWRSVPTRFPERRGRPPLRYRQHRFERDHLLGTLIALIDTIGHDGPSILIAVELAVTLIFGFQLCRRQVSMPLPLLPIDLLRIPIFAISVLTCICSFAAQMLALVALPFHLQAIGYSAVETGLLITPWPLATAVLAPIAGRLSDRYPAGLLGLLIDGIRRRLRGPRAFADARWNIRYHLAHGAGGRGIRPLSITAAPCRPAAMARRFDPEHGASGRNHRRLTGGAAFHRLVTIGRRGRSTRR